MVKKDDLKEEFSKRLRAALLDAGVGGRGQAKRIREAMKSQGVSVYKQGFGSGLIHQQYQTKPISLPLVVGLGLDLTGWNTEGMSLNLRSSGNHPSRLNLSGEPSIHGTKTRRCQMMRLKCHS